MSFVKGEHWKIRLDDGSVYSGMVTLASKGKIHLLTDYDEKVVISETDIARARKTGTEAGSGVHAKTK